MGYNVKLSQVRIVLISNITQKEIALNAKNQKFDTIQCSRLEVVDADGVARLILSINEHGGHVGVYGKDGQLASLSINERGGHAGVYGKIGAVGIEINEHGGVVGVYGKDGELQKLRSMLGNNDEHGGVVGVKGKGEGKAVMGINEDGNGDVSTWDKDGYRQ